MHILHVFDHSIPLQSGYTFRSRAILDAQRARGWTTTQVTGGKQGKVSGASELVDGLTFHRTPPDTGPLAALPLLNQLAVVRGLEHRLTTLVEASRPDLLHAHSPALNGLAALRVGRRFGIPVVYEIRAFWEDAAVDHGTSKEGGLRYRLTRMLETHVARRVSAVFTICEGLRADLVARGLPAAQVTVIPNAVDPAAFAYESPRDAELATALGIGDAPVLGFIGSFYAYEGLLDLVAALPGIRARLPELRILLVGGGPTQAAVAAEVARLGLGDAVILTGRVPHAEVDRYYSLVDVFCYPRRPMRLTDLVTPLKPLEAMAQGKIVLASDVGGHRELVRHDHNGWLFRAGDPAALAQAVEDLFAARARWPSLRASGRHFVETERNWPASVARYADVYARVLR